MTNAQPGRWLAFRAKGAAPTDTNVQVTIGPGTPSEEGPRKTIAPQAYFTQTYAPLRVTWQRSCHSVTTARRGTQLVVQQPDRHREVQGGDDQGHARAEGAEDRGLRQLPHGERTIKRATYQMVPAATPISSGRRAG